MFVLESIKRKKPIVYSPVFDLESFFWVLLFSILYSGYQSLEGEDLEAYRRLVPKNFSSDYDNDVVKKTVILIDFQNRFFDFDKAQILCPYESLICQLADLVWKYYVEVARPRSKISSEKEKAAVDEYIEAFEKFIKERQNNSVHGDIKPFQHGVDEGLAISQC